MHQYTAARSAFGLLEFLAWTAIVIGGLVAVVSMLAGLAGGGFGFLVGLWVALPALAVVFVGIIGLVLVQSGRAGVDTAKWTYEMLEIAKTQLHMAEEAEKRRNREGTLVPAEVTKPTPQSKYGINGDHRKEPAAREPGEVTVLPASPSPVTYEPSKTEKITYQGIAIDVNREGAFIYGQRFRDLDAAKLHIEREGVYGSSAGHRPQLIATPAGLG